MDSNTHLQVEFDECYNAIRMMQFFMRRFENHFNNLKELYDTNKQTQPSCGDVGCDKE